MIAFLRGTLTSKLADRVEIDVDGVGYEVHLSQRSLQSARTGEQVTFKTYLHVREDALQIYGFPGDSERQAFLLLLSVSGVGPKVALNVLAVFSPETLYQAIVRNDIASLRAVPGVGQKTAHHMVLELRDKAARLGGEGNAMGDRLAPLEAASFNDTVSALVALGYGANESRKAAMAAVQALGEKAGVEELLKFGLKSM